MTDPAVKTRVLKKVRRQYLNKRPEDEEEAQDNIATLPATPEQLNDPTVRVLEPSIGLVEENRAICAGAHFYNTNFKLKNVLIENQPQSQAVILGLENKETDILPWEYCVKRLESYGNLELMTWAQRVKEYREHHPKLMARYFEMVHSQDPLVQAKFMAAKTKAMSACKFIEGNFSYYKVSVFSNKTGTVPISTSYNEGMLKEMGHSIESFVDWTKKNGVPGVFHRESPVHTEISKSFLANNLLRGDLFHDGTEYFTFLYDKDGNKKFLRIQVHLVLEPVQDGFFRYGYVTVRNPKDQDVDITIKEDDALKIIKKEDDGSVNDSCETVDTGSRIDEHSSTESADEL